MFGSRNVNNTQEISSRSQKPSPTKLFLSRAVEWAHLLGQMVSICWSHENAIFRSILAEKKDSTLKCVRAMWYTVFFQADWAPTFANKPLHTAHAPEWLQMLSCSLLYSIIFYMISLAFTAMHIFCCVCVRRSQFAIFDCEWFVVRAAQSVYKRVHWERYISISTQVVVLSILERDREKSKPSASSPIAPHSSQPVQCYHGFLLRSFSLSICVCGRIFIKFHQKVFQL